MYNGRAFFVCQSLTLKRAATVYKLTDDFSGDQQERGSLYIMPHRSRKLRTFTQKELETVRPAQEIAWCADYQWVECRARGWRWRESKKSNKSSKLLGMYKNGTKTASFLHIFTLHYIFTSKSLKPLFFTYVKVLHKYTPKKFFEGNINFKIFQYLRRCGVIPVQGFGSHMHPQPPGLGLTHLTITLPPSPRRS